MPKLTSFLIIPAIVVYSVAVSGCSAIGYGLGCVVDSSTRDTAWVGGSSVLRIEHLDTTGILMKDRTRLEGNHLQAVHVPKRMYEDRYLEAVETGGLILPRLYDTVDVRRLPGTSAKRTVSGEFRGFGIDTTGAGGTVKVMLGSEVKAIGLSTVEKINSRDGREWDGRELNKQVEQLPLDRAIHLNLAGGDTLLAVGDIDSVRALSESGWKWLGLGIGATVDIIAIVTLASLNLDYNLFGSGNSSRAR